MKNRYEKYLAYMLYPDCCCFNFDFHELSMCHCTVSTVGPCYRSGTADTCVFKRARSLCSYADRKYQLFRSSAVAAHDLKLRVQC